MQNKQEREPQPATSPRTNNFLRYSSMASQMGITIFLGVWGGKKLDEKFPQKIPVFTLTLSLVSVVLAIYLVIRDFLKKK